jgi:RES domain-containing protein
MIITARRITQKSHADGAFTGLGAWLEAGRWNQKGVHMVYTAQSLSLAALETVVHLPADALLYNLYVYIPVEFDSKLVFGLPSSSLAADWKNHPPPDSTREIGTSWVKEQKSPVLKVPSSVIPEEYNYLINPLHSDFARLKIGKAISFLLDPRIKLDPATTH